MATVSSSKGSTKLYLNSFIIHPGGDAMLLYVPIIPKSFQVLCTGPPIFGTQRQDDLTDGLAIGIFLVFLKW